MGQMFDVAVYDIEKNECYSEDVDSFHANCYSFSFAICSTHYLLRQAPYRVMWSGAYVVLDDAITSFLSNEKLLGISVTKDLDDFQRNNEDLASKPYYEQIKLMDEHHRAWNRISVDAEAEEYFDFENTHTVPYSGYLVNHSKKLAIDLHTYYEKSASLTQRMEKFVIDPIPPLTETGEGTIMALFDGCPTDVTEQLIGTWCGDLLQIVEKCPADYEEISCCFASIWERARYCKQNFGLDNEQFILKNKEGKRFEAIRLSPYLTRGTAVYIKFEKTENGTYLKPISIT